MRRKRGRAVGGARKDSAGSVGFALQIDFIHAPDHLEQSRAAGDAVCFQGRGYGKADCLFGPRGVRHDKVCRKRVKLPLDTLYRGIKRF